jgi:hypothetical protein
MLIEVPLEYLLSMNGALISHVLTFVQRYNLLLGHL